MHRIMKAVAIKQLQAASPALYDPKAVDARIMRMIGVADPYSLFAPPAPPQPDPEVAAKQAELQLKAQGQQQDMQAKMAEQKNAAIIAAQTASSKQDQTKTESADRAADRASRERVAGTREETERIKLIGELAQQGHVPPEVALSAATGKPVKPMPQQAPQPVQPGLTPAPAGAFFKGGVVEAPSETE
jgi:hypothetical protein